MFHGSGLTDHCPARSPNPLDSIIDVIDSNGDMAKTGSAFLVMLIPVGSQLNDRGLGFFPIADKSQCEPTLRVVAPPEQAHPQYFRIEAEGLLEVSHP
jgi:hypothetical protein